MNKHGLISAVADNIGATKRSTEEVVEAVIAAIQTTVAKGEDVTVIGFGTFSRSRKAARAGRNPMTGEAITIKAKNVVKFKPGKAFKAQANK